ncbi:MAG: substrate-binding domain-containing protein [Coriobacteriales bacterium]|jgi:putative molybdopterin biosynthesis protein
MSNEDALTAEDVAEILHVGRNAVYDLAKSGELGSYRIGRRLRFTYSDVQAYIEHTKTGRAESSPVAGGSRREQLVICGQDIILDVLSNYITQAGFECLRSYVGSYDALTALYKGEVQVASAHLWDGDTNTYNIPFVKRMLPGVPAVIIHLTDRTQGLYVRRGNPKGISDWADLVRPGIVMVNREKGAGSRVLLDEHLRLLDADPSQIAGYDTEVQSHIAVASAVARGRADVAVGSEKVARQVEGIDFIPLQKEKYDLVVRRSEFESRPIQAMMDILESGIIRDEFAGLGGYDTSDMGRIVSID